MVSAQKIKFCCRHYFEMERHSLMTKPDRILSALLAGVLGCFLLAGCSKPAPQDKPVENGVPADTGEKSAMPSGGPAKP